MSSGQLGRFRMPVFLAAATLALLALVTLTLGAAKGSADSLAAGSPPNIVVIVTDDQRADGTMEIPNSPDWMPKTLKWFRDGASGITGGREFTEGYVSTPACCPSRASILTGRYAHNHGVRTVAEGEDLDQRFTLQAYLKRAGYQTAAFGKFLNGWHVGAGLGAAGQGQDPLYFDRFSVMGDFSLYCGFRVNEQGVSKRVPPAGAYNPECDPDRLGLPNAPDSPYATHYWRDLAVDYIENQQQQRDPSKPFFLYLAFNAPHAQFTPEAAYKDTAVPGFQENPAYQEGHCVGRNPSDPGSDPLADKPPWVRNERICEPDPQKADADFKSNVERTRNGQLRTLKSVDDAVEDVFQALRTKLDGGGSPLEQNTLAFYLSDNGFIWGEHGLYGKWSPYTDSIRVPFLMRWPAGPVVPGTDNDTIAANVDIAPTAMAAAGLEPDPGYPMDGVSLLGGPQRDRLLSESWDQQQTPPAGDWGSLRTASPCAAPPCYQYSKYDDYPVTQTVDPFEEYYAANDPWQLENRFGSDGAPGDPGEPAVPGGLEDARTPNPQNVDPRYVDFESTGYGDFDSVFRLPRFDAIQTDLGSLVRVQNPSLQFGGQHAAQATITAGATPTSPGTAAGSFHVFWRRCSVEPNEPADACTGQPTGYDDVNYRALFRLPLNFFQQQQGDLFLMRWDNQPSHGLGKYDYGGIVLRDSDGKAHLVRGQAGGAQVDIGPGFAVPENRWFQLVVDQTLAATDPQASNSVTVWDRVGGLQKPVSNLQKANMYQGNGYERPIDQIKYGVISYPGPVTTHVDCAGAMMLPCWIRP